MKKLLAVVLAIAMIFCFAACGEKKEEKQEEVAKVWPEGIKEVTVLVPNKVGAMLDQSTRIMVAYLNEKYPDTNFVIENDDGSGNAACIKFASAPGDGSVIMAHGSGAIIQYYQDQWDYNLADPSYAKAICGNVGQLQPSGGVFLINPNEKRFTDIPSLVEYVKANPGTVRFSYGIGTPHMIRMMLITNYYGITDLVNWVPGPTTDVRAWIQGGNTDVAILTETTACADARGGVAVAILDSLDERNYTDDIADVLDNCPIVTDLPSKEDPSKKIEKSVASTLVCAHPMTIFGPASMSEETAKQINAACAGIADRADYMEQIKALGSSNTYQIFSYEEINQITQAADKQIKDSFNSMK